LDRVGGVMLTRHQRVAQVRVALDGGRYVEIRGDAGVGKSGVLKHCAEQISGEAQVIVLSPSREVGGKKVILPVCYGVGFEEVRQYWPTLADRLAVPTKNGLESVVLSF
jgi:hypothetical protein